MHLYEQPTNTAARGSNNAERSHWRDQGVDPELVADPFDVAAATYGNRSASPTALTESPVYATRTLSADVAASVMQRAEAYTPNPATQAVQLSFDVRPR